MFKIFEKCQVGDILSGKIVDIKSAQNKIYVVNLKGELFSAYSEINFIVGEKVDLKVLSTQNPLSLKLLKADVTKNENRENSKIIKLLNSCNIEINTINIRKLEDYINSGKPVQLDLILNLFR